MNDKRFNKLIESIDKSEIKVADKETEALMVENEANRKKAKKEPVKWMFKDNARRKVFNKFKKDVGIEQAYLITKECTDEEIKILSNGK